MNPRALRLRQPISLLPAVLHWYWRLLPAQRWPRWNGRRDGLEAPSSMPHLLLVWRGRGAAYLDDQTPYCSPSTHATHAPLTSQVLTPCVFLPRSPYPGRHSTPPDDRLSVKPTYVGKNSYRRQRVYLKEVYNRFLDHVFRYNHPIKWSVMFKDIAFRYLNFVSMSLPRRNR
jgi:hypothetical protein